MSAFDMVERCAEAQWRGLSEEERATLRWKGYRYVGQLSDSAASNAHLPGWYVRIQTGWLGLVILKRDG